MPRVLLPLALAACAPPATWTDADLPDGVSWSTVWGTSSEDVWVGGGDADGARLVHFDGATWDEATLPEAGLVAWVHGTATDDVWAACRGGDVLHFDGEAWAAVESGTDDDLWGVCGTEQERWFVGGTVDAGDPLLLHHDGSTFTPSRPTGDANPKQATSVFKVWGAGTTVFAVGQHGAVWRQRGAAWEAVSAGPDADEDLIALWGTSDDRIYAVGGRNTPRTAAWDGSTWSTDKPPPAEVRPLSAVFARGEDEVLVGGLYGYLATWTPSQGTFEAFPVATDVGIHATWCAQDAACFAVAGTFTTPHRGAVLTLGL